MRKRSIGKKVSRRDFSLTGLWDWLDSEATPRATVTVAVLLGGCAMGLIALSPLFGTAAGLAVCAHRVLYLAARGRL